MSDSPRQKRSGSEQRQKQGVLTFRVDHQLQEKIEADAAAQGLSVGSYMRWLADEKAARIRPTRRPIPGEALLLQLKGEAGRVDGNLAQILKVINRGDFVPVDEVAEAAKAVRDFYIAALETLKGRA